MVKEFGVFWKLLNSEIGEFEAFSALSFFLLWTKNFKNLFFSFFFFFFNSFEEKFWETEKFKIFHLILRQNWSMECNDRRFHRKYVYDRWNRWNRNEDIRKTYARLSFIRFTDIKEYTTISHSRQSESIQVTWVVVIFLLHRIRCPVFTCSTLQLVPPLIEFIRATSLDSETTTIIRNVLVLKLFVSRNFHPNSATLLTILNFFSRFSSTILFSLLSRRVEVRVESLFFFFLFSTVRV